MKLLYSQTQEEFEAEIVEIEGKDLRQITKEKQFQFDWSKEKNVFKIIKLNEDNPKILGLISITNIPEELRIHINLIENSNENKGKKKKVDKVAGCLLAFAIQISFEKGYLGFTSLIPKSELIKLYVEKYGFSQFGRQLAIEKKAAINLIQKYF